MFYKVTGLGVVPLPLPLPRPLPLPLPVPVPLPLPLAVLAELDGGAKASNPPDAGDGVGDDAKPAAMRPARGAKYSSTNKVQRVARELS